MIASFTIPKPVLKKILRKYVWNMVFFYLILLLSAVVADSFGLLYIEPSGLSSLSSLIGLLTYFFIYDLYLKIKYYRTYQLIIEGNHITELYDGIEQSAFIMERAGTTDQGGWYILGTGIWIYVPPFIENKEKFESCLPIDKTLYYKESKGWMRTIQTYPYFLYAIFIAGFHITNKVVMTASGVLLIFLCVAGIWWVNQNKNLSEKEKKSAYAFVIMIIIVIMSWEGRFFT
jgi:hypothetical protein